MTVPPLNPLGIELTALVALLLVAGGIALDLYLELTNRASLGGRISRWARRYPLFMAAVALVFGMMVGHFFFSLPVR